MKKYARMVNTTSKLGYSRLLGCINQQVDPQDQHQKKISYESNQPQGAKVNTDMKHRRISICYKTVRGFAIRTACLLKKMTQISSKYSYWGTGPRFMPIFLSFTAMCNMGKMCRFYYTPIKP